MEVFELVRYYDSFGGNDISVVAIFSTEKLAEDYAQKYNYPMVDGSETECGRFGKYEIITVTLDDTSNNDKYEAYKKRKEEEKEKEIQKKINKINSEVEEFLLSKAYKVAEEFNNSEAKDWNSFYDKVNKDPELSKYIVVCLKENLKHERMYGFPGCDYFSIKFINSFYRGNKPFKEEFLEDVRKNIENLD